jgi:hypothetical protein
MSNSKRKIRASVSIPEDHYRLLEELANEKRVSVSWVVREAVERYIGECWPLLATNNQSPTESKDP